MMGRRRSRCPFSQLRSVSTVLNGNFALNNATGVILNVHIIIDSQMTYVKEHLYLVIIAMFSDEHGRVIPTWSGT